MTNFPQTREVLSKLRAGDAESAQILADAYRELDAFENVDDSPEEPVASES